MVEKIPVLLVYDTFLILRKSSGLGKVLEKLFDWLKSTATRKLVSGSFLFVLVSLEKPVIAPWSLKSEGKVKVGESKEATGGRT